MQKRHQNRRRYFTELANTSRDYYLDYLRCCVLLGKGTRILEIGCGEGGNLLPFAEVGCEVVGIDLSEWRIQQARSFFESCGREGQLHCKANALAGQSPLQAEIRTAPKSAVAVGW